MPGPLIVIAGSADPKRTDYEPPIPDVGGLTPTRHRFIHVDIHQGVPRPLSPASVPALLRRRVEQLC